MSYRDLRNLTEMLRALGYNRLVSLENFKTPNFSLLSEILEWLLTCFDQDSFIRLGDSQSCSDRVKFINLVSEFMLTRLNKKVNPKKLYEADGLAVIELLKIVTVMYDGLKNINYPPLNFCSEDISIEPESNSKENKVVSNYQKNELCPEGEDESYSLLTSLTTRTDELKEARTLARELTEKAANLYFKLESEACLYNKRMLSLSKHYNIVHIEDFIGDKLKEANNEINRMLKLLEQLTADELRLEEKFEKKVQEMERCLRRYDILKNVKPVHLKEFESAEIELSCLYTNYMEKYRNVVFLENILSKYELVEKQLKEMAVNKVKNDLLKSKNSANLFTGLLLSVDEKDLKSTATNKNKESRQTSMAQNQRNFTDLYLLDNSKATNSDFFTDHVDDDDDDDEEDDDECDEEDASYVNEDDEENNNNNDDDDVNRFGDEGGQANVNNNKLLTDNNLSYRKGRDDDDDDSDDDDDDYDFGKRAALMMMMNENGDTNFVNKQPGFFRYNWNDPNASFDNFRNIAGTKNMLPCESYLKGNKSFGDMLPESDDDDDDF